MDVKISLRLQYYNVHAYFNVLVTSRDLQTSRLGLGSVSGFNVSCPSLRVCLVYRTVRDAAAGHAVDVDDHRLSLPMCRSDVLASLSPRLSAMLQVLRLLRTAARSPVASRRRQRGGEQPRQLSRERCCLQASTSPTGRFR